MQSATAPTSSQSLNSHSLAAMRAMAVDVENAEAQSEPSVATTEVDQMSQTSHASHGVVDASPEQQESKNQGTTGRSSLALKGEMVVVTDPNTKRASLTAGAAPHGRSSLMGVMQGGRASVGEFVEHGMAVIAGGRRASMFSMLSGEEPAKEEKEYLAADVDKEEHEQAAAWDTSKFERDELATQSAALTWKNVTFSVAAPDPEDLSGRKKVDKIILDNAWGHLEPGTLTALMGPSGCGKTTLLDILAKKKTASYVGEVFMNGHPVDKLYSRMTSYVSQQDIIPPHWTVLEAVTFDALLKKPCPKGVTRDNFQVYVSGVLEDVGLLHVKDTKIGNDSIRGISGGQRRRVTLARGIVSKAALMFCDEPTSGLSATDAELCIKALLGISRRWNVTILVVIHQPRVEVADLFDHVVFLTSRPGRIVYNGPMKDAGVHWAKARFPVPGAMNPTDYILDTISPGVEGADPEAFVNYYNKHVLPKIEKAVEHALESPGKSAMDMLVDERDMMAAKIGDVPKVNRSVHGTSWMTQFKALLHRKLKLTFKDPQLLAVLFLAKIIMGLMYGILMQGKGDSEPKGAAQIPVLFLCLQCVTLQAMLVMPLTFEERLIMKTEVSQALYGNTAYIMSTSIVDITLSILGTIPQLAVLNALADMDWSKFHLLVMWCVILGLSMDALVLSLAAACKSMVEAQAAVTTLLTIPIMFGGLLVNRRSVPEFLAWLLDVSPVNIAMEQLSYTFYGQGCQNLRTVPVSQDCMGWYSIQFFYGHEKPSDTTLILSYSMYFVVFRILHGFALAKLNNVAK